MKNFQKAYPGYDEYDMTPAQKCYQRRKKQIKRRKKNN